MTADTLPKAIRIKGHLYRLANDGWQLAMVDKARDQLEDVFVGNRSIPEGAEQHAADVAISALYAIEELYKGNQEEADYFLKQVDLSMQRLSSIT